MDLLDTSVAIYEKNGDYAYGVFASGWCQLMDSSSRKLCHSKANRQALDSGHWLCHENCWNQSAKPVIMNGKPADIDCVGGIKLYAEPIYADGEIVGAINIGYGNPPTDEKKLQELAGKFHINFDLLKAKATEYKPRPPFITGLAKKRLKSIAKLIGEIVSRKKAEAALQESEERFRSFMNHFPGAAFIKNEQNVILYCNEHFAQLLGSTPEKLINKDISENLPGELIEKYRAENDSVIHEKKVLISESNFPIDGVNTYWLSYKFPISTGGVTLVGDISLDITERKKIEHALQENHEQLKESNTTKDKLFSIIGHDLKGPLGNIHGFTKLLLKEYDKYPEEKIQHFLSMIHQSTLNLTYLLDNLLTWSRSRGQKLEIEPKEMNAFLVIEECFSFLQASAAQKGINLQNNVSSGTKVYADEKMITTVVRNLVSNAIKFTGQNGRVKIFDHVSEENQVIINVQDNGVGMSLEKKESLFKADQMQSSKGTQGEKGTGLGLLICKDFIEKNHGNIWVESALGHGTTFSFALPMFT
jgi:PAS domain S-box-containing protein